MHFYFADNITSRITSIIFPVHPCYDSISVGIDAFEWQKFKYERLEITLS